MIRCRYTLILTICLLASSCASVIDATTEGPINTDPGKRSFGTYIDDRQLQAIVKVNINQSSPELREAKIRVHCFNQVILITGKVPTEALRTQAGNISKNVNRVRQVHNELKIAEATSIASRIRDKWLKNKIKAKLVADSSIDSDRVKIIVEDSVVYLMGFLSKAETEKITDAVRRVNNVKRVVRAIEYLEPVNTN